jgi:hypothetical protein
MTRPKFSIQKATCDFTSKIQEVIGRIVCDKHGARLEEPCWWLRNDRGQERAAICNTRARKIYTGTSTEKSSTSKYVYKRKQKENAA